MSFIKINEINIHCGISKKMCVYQISDTHAIFVNDKLSKEELNLAKNNELAWKKVRVDFAKYYHESYEDSNIATYLCFSNIISYLKKQKSDLLLLSGDIIDYCSLYNLKKYEETMQDYGKDYLLTIGNHESDYQKYINASFDFVYKEFDEIIFVSIDNSSLKYNEKQIESLKEVLKKGKKIIIIEHVPIRNEYNYELLKNYQKYFIIDKSTCDDISKQMIDIFETNPNIIAILAGHHHGHSESFISENKKQYICSSGLIGMINKYNID